MSESKVIQPEQSESVIQARAKAERLAHAFAMVVGQPKARTEDQKLFLAHLEVQASEDSNSYQFNQNRDGISVIAAGIHRDGAKSVLRVIDRQLTIASQLKQPAKAKPKTVR